MVDIEEEIRDLMESGIGSNIKKYYAGRVKEPPHSYLPLLCVYGERTNLLSRSTNRDRHSHQMVIDVFTSPFGKVKTSEDPDLILQAEKEVKCLMEEREADGTPKSTTVLGVLMRNIKGLKFLFTDEDVIDYTEITQNGKLFYKATITFRANRAYVNRS